MNAVDTNVLIYVYDPRNATKQAVASALIKSLDEGVLLWQVACEFIAASRKLLNVGYSQKDAFDDIRKMRTIWSTATPTWKVYDLSEQLIERFQLSYWDALIVAACLEAGVQRLYTEDFSGNPRIDKLEIVNPFA